MPVKSETYDGADWDELQDASETRRPRKAKRRKTITTAARASIIPLEEPQPLELRLDSLRVVEASFEDILGTELISWAQERQDGLREAARLDEEGTLLQGITRSMAQDILFEHASLSPDSAMRNLVKRKLETSQGRNRLEDKVLMMNEVHPLPQVEKPPPPDEVLSALHAIRQTPFRSSFISRLHGCLPDERTPVIFVDWETCSPWMNLMEDIRDHYILSHPEADPVVEVSAPITYVTLSRRHLRQVHDLLSRTFWEGIDVSDSLNYEPEKCTVVATYKRLVVGVALLSEPQHTYVTYLAVKAGWENAQIATTMLYHLIKLNPGRHITLHVSANNPAMLLYNRFGFKAEQFVVGFYDAYLNPQSRASKNAFFLRLRP